MIVGGGSHGLAIAYYLARDHGITDVCILEKSYIGSGAAGRNTTILRSNYKTPEGARFYDASVKLYERLGAELNFNLLFSQEGHLTLAHTDRAMFVMAERAEVNQLEGIDSKVIGPEEIGRLAPAMSIAPDAVHPVMGALYHPPGGIIRHDAVVWGLARGADRGGAEIHPYNEVAGSSAPTAARPGSPWPTGAGSRPATWSAPPRAGARRSPRWPESSCRSPPTSCRRS